MSRFVPALILAAGIAALAGAAPVCQHDAQPAVVQVPVGQVLIPVYSAVYTPPQQTGDPSTAELLRELIAEIKAMRAELAASRLPPQMQLAIADGKRALTTNCIKCHGHDAAPTKGDGFALFDRGGELLPLADRDRQRVHARVSRNSMPPAPAKLNPADREAILKAFAPTK